MTPKPSLKRNTLANFVGSALPMIVSLITVPMYLHHVGAARYGVLAIVWMLQGYFGYFDVGLAAATANRIAQLGESTPAERESVLWTALVLNLAMGCAAGLLLFAVGNFLFSQFHLVPELHAEVRQAMPWIACTVPLALVSAVFSGALIGREQFAQLNAVQFVSVLIFQVVPLAAAIALGPDLLHVIGAATLSSTVAVAIKIGVVAKAFPLRFAGLPTKRWIKPLFSYGVWVAVSNILGPMLDTVDRFVIGSVLGPQSVAHYQVPSNLAVRVRILPGAICGSLSPRLASLDRASAMALASRALRALSAALTPMIVFGIFLMQPFLTLWVGRDFAEHAGPIGAVIVVGVWFNCLAHVPYCHVQAIGRPNVGAYNHAAQVVPYIACLWAALHAFGLIGAAYVWALRSAIDFAVMFWAAGYRAGAARSIGRHAVIVLCAYGLMLLFPWHSCAYLVTWTLTTAAAIALVLGHDAALRARLTGTIATLLRGAWRRS